MAPAIVESTLGYHSKSTGTLTRDHKLVLGHCQVGSLTGAVASQKSNGGVQRLPQRGWKSRIECKGIR